MRRRQVRGCTDSSVYPFALAALGILGGALVIAARALAGDRPVSPVCADQRGGPADPPGRPMPGGVAGSLTVYLRSALTLRDIHSLKLTRARRWAEWLRFGLIALSITATCLSFIGAAKVSSDIAIDKGVVDFAINVLLLLLLIVIVAELAWRQGDRAHEHQRAIVVLTRFIRDLENRLREPVSPGDVELVERFGERHSLIIEILPAHTDSDYLAAKKASAEKRVEKEKIRLDGARRIEQLVGVNEGASA
jgi:hypothetical protein